MKINPQKIVLKNSKELLLRSLESSDAQEMLRHLVLTHTESYQNLNRTPDYWKKLSVEEESKILEDFANAKNKFFVAALEGSQIVGALGLVGNSVQFGTHNGSIGMSIQNAYSGYGLATKMMNVAIQFAKEIGFSRLELTVRTYNQPAIHVYEKLGFKRIGKLTKVAKIDGNYVDEYAYEKLLE